MIQDRIGRHQVLSPIIITITKFVRLDPYFKIKTQQLTTVFARSEKKKPFKCGRILSNYLAMTRTVILHCPIGAEIRTVISKSDLRTSFVIVMINALRVILNGLHILSKQKKKNNCSTAFFFSREGVLLRFQPT